MATTDTMPAATEGTTFEQHKIQNQQADDACLACAHPMSAHDVISARFCTATLAGALSRGCVCPHDR
jgi:hypothetical protein